MDNTNYLLGKELKDLKKEPVFPVYKKESLGKAIFFGVLDAVVK
ncbi:hypothetical protein [Flavobacterium ovatum]